MRFKVLKAGFDCIDGTESDYATIDDVLKDVTTQKGWVLEALRAAVRKWSANCHPGDTFRCSHMVIIATPPSGEFVDGECPNCLSENLSYKEPECGEFHVKQVGWCDDCGERWEDMYTLAERVTINKGK